MIFKIVMKHSSKEKMTKLCLDQKSFAKHTKIRKTNYLINLIDDKENKQPWLSLQK